MLNQSPDGRQLQLYLTGFLTEKPARLFMGELWKHLISAQESPHGIPEELVALKQKQIEEEQVSSRLVSLTCPLSSSAMDPVIYVKPHRRIRKRANAFVRV